MKTLKINCGPKSIIFSDLDSDDLIKISIDGPPALSGSPNVYLSGADLIELSKHLMYLGQKIALKG